MGRSKTAEESALKYDVKTRVNQATYDHLCELLQGSRHRTMAEIIREILVDQPIKVYTVDHSVKSVVDELSRIRQQINAIGININQVIRYFNTVQGKSEKLGFLLEITEFHHQLNDHLNEMKPLIELLTKKWLHG